MAQAVSGAGSVALSGASVVFSAACFASAAASVCMCVSVTPDKACGHAYPLPRFLPPPPSPPSFPCPPCRRPPPPPPRAPAPLRARASVSGLGTLISVSSSRFRAPLPLLHHVHNLHDMHNGMDGIMACAAWTPWSLVPRRVRDAPHHCAHSGGLSVEKQPAVFAPWSGGRYGPVCPVRMLVLSVLSVCWPVFSGPMLVLSVLSAHTFPANPPPLLLYVCVCVCIRSSV